MEVEALDMCLRKHPKLLRLCSSHLRFCIIPTVPQSFPSLGITKPSQSKKILIFWAMEKKRLERKMMQIRSKGERFRFCLDTL